MIEVILIIMMLGTLVTAGVAIKQLNKKPIVQARNEKGQFIPDDPNTKYVNEAWVGGKAPTSKKSNKKVTK